MSLILKNSVVFPIFKHHETLTFHRRDQISRQGTWYPNHQTDKLTHQGESGFERSQKMNKKPLHSLQGYLDHLNSVRTFMSPLVEDATIKKIKEEVQLFQIPQPNNIESLLNNYII